MFRKDYCFSLMVNVLDLLVMKSYHFWRKKTQALEMDLNFQTVVSRVCFGSFTSLVEDKFLGTHWGCTFPVGLVFQLFFGASV